MSLRNSMKLANMALLRGLPSRSLREEGGRRGSPRGERRHSCLVCTLVIHVPKTSRPSDPDLNNSPSSARGWSLCGKLAMAVTVVSPSPVSKDPGKAPTPTAATEKARVPSPFLRDPRSRLSRGQLQGSDLSGDVCC